MRLAAGALPPERDDTPGTHTSKAATHGDIYRVFFHGPAYQVIDEAWHSGRTAVAALARTLPAAHVPASTTIMTEPRLAEACFQTAGLWEIGQAGRMALPAHTDAGHPAAQAAVWPVSALRDGPAAADGAFDCRVVDGEGDVVLRVDGYRTISVDSPLPAEPQAAIHDAMSD